MDHTSHSFRHRVYLAVEAPPGLQRKQRYRLIGALIAGLILLNVLSSMLATVETVDARHGDSIVVFELASA